MVPCVLNMPDFVGDEPLGLHPRLGSARKHSPEDLVHHVPRTGRVGIPRAWQVGAAKVQRQQAIERLSGRLRRTALLPTCGLADQAHGLDRHGRLAPTITKMSLQDRRLWPVPDAPCTWWGYGPSQILVDLDRWIYPSRCRPLLRRHLVMLRVRRLDLRDELALPGASGGVLPGDFPALPQQTKAKR